MDGKSKSMTVTRGYIRSKVTRLHGDITVNVSNYDHSIASRLVLTLKDHLSTLNEMDQLILTNLWDDDTPDDDNANNQAAELDRIAQYKDMINECLTLLDERIKSSSTNVTNNHNVLPIFNSASRLKPETAPLPTYGGERDESLEKFIFSFENIVNAHQYSEFEKFLLLQKCMTGRASVLITSLEADNQSYADAKALLEQAFASPLTQKYNALDRLVALNDLKDKDPLYLVSEMRQIQEMFVKLKIDVNVVLQFFYWRALPDLVKTQLVSVTNQCKPDLMSIQQNIFQAIERAHMHGIVADNSMKTPKFSKRETSNYAIKVDRKEVNSEVENKQIVCSLCSGDHKYFKCFKYKNPSDKVSRLKELGGCTKCGQINHNNDSCKLINLKCKLCTGAHFPCLCLKDNNGAISKNDVNRKVGKTDRLQSRTNNNIVWTSRVGGTADGTALPTFTAVVDNKLVRVMKDTGAQATLISKNFADKCNFEVLQKDISITINGFNEKKLYVTNLVKVPVKVGKSTFCLKALVVPKIDIVLEVPGLGSFIKLLHDKGYEIADKLLDFNVNYINNIDIVLGSDSAYCNPVTTKVFGKDMTSTLLLTSQGVMLEGSIDKLSEDINFLPCCPSTVNNFNVTVNEQTNFITDSSGKLSQTNLDKAVDHVLENQCNFYLNKDNEPNESNVEVNVNLSNYVLDNTSRNEEGRLIMPLMWNSEVQHLLGRNYNLAKQILKSNFRKLSKDPEKLQLTDKVFSDQENMGIIERIDNFEDFKSENPNYSFLPHMSVFRMNKETTKCRVVYLSNIAENDHTLPRTLSHNQTINSGPNLNQKLSVALLMLKFDKYILTYDLVKAFSMIAMYPIDQARLLLMWYENVNAGNFNIVYYKANRLPFGISCAPALLMLALHKILIEDDDCTNDKLTELRKMAYALLYMDNGGIGANNLDDLLWAKDKLVEIFGDYKFNLQQFVTNSETVQEKLDVENKCETKQTVGLYGLKWNRVEDTLCTAPLHLDQFANTKRLCLKTYAENFDLYGYNLPLLNRAKLYIHKLQCDSSLKWDDELNANYQKEWKLISKQANNSKVAKVPRFVGSRSDSYDLVAYTDASKDLYGVVLYLFNRNTSTLNFLLCKNKVVGKNLEGKSIPSLECAAVAFGVEVLMDTLGDVCNSNLMSTINVESMTLFTDSMVVLNWLDSVSNKLSKNQNKLSIFVRNCLFRVQKLCKIKPVSFKFICGEENPADKVTRAVSVKQLCKTNFYSGPMGYLSDCTNTKSDISVTVPCPDYDISNMTLTVENNQPVEVIVSPRKYSCFNKLVNVYAKVLKFVNILKGKIGKAHSDEIDYIRIAKISLIKQDQQVHYLDCINYFNDNKKSLKSMPNIVKQLNVYLDSEGILRVRSKFKDRLVNNTIYEPILMSKHSDLASLIIGSMHVRFAHAGKYSVLTELRKEFYIPSMFSKVKKVIADCSHCARFNSRAIVNNQSSYKAERINPSVIPFRTMYMDHFGPYNVKIAGTKTKIYLLLFSCMFTRAFNAEICMDMSVNQFLRAFQSHCHKYGMPSKVTSDPGSTLIAGGNSIMSFINDESVGTYLSQYGINRVQFNHYCKGNSSLGGLVESGVKLYKKLIFGFVRNNCLDIFDFQFLISDVNHLINKRPVAFIEAARDTSLDVPDVITPEMLIHGHSLPSVNCISGLQPIPDDPDWVQNPHACIINTFNKLESVRSKMLELYHGEFHAKLLHQAVDSADRYKPKVHSQLKIGDIVTINEKFYKPCNRPLAIVKDLTYNDLGEVTNVTLKRGDTKETITRHVKTLIPLLSLETNISESGPNIVKSEVKDVKKIPDRKAAVAARAAMRSQLNC